MDNAEQDGEAPSYLGALEIEADELDAEDDEEEEADDEEDEDEDEGDDEDNDEDNDEGGQAGAPAFLAQLMGLNAQQIDSLQNVLTAMQSGMRREGRLEGLATSGERARLDLARGQQPDLRSILAISVSRVASHLRQLAVPLPEEMILAIAQEVCRSEAEAGSLHLRACKCGQQVHGQARIGRATLTFASPPLPACRAVCWRCGETSIMRCMPRVRPLHDGQWHDLQPGTLAVKAGLKPCRHFHIEAGGTFHGAEAVDAVRHRMSGLHSFRTIVASEWLLSGAITYEVRLGLLRAPLAIAVGCAATATTTVATAAATPLSPLPPPPPPLPPPPRRRCRAGAWRCAATPSRPPPEQVRDA